MKQIFLLLIIFSVQFAEENKLTGNLKTDIIFGLKNDSTEQNKIIVDKKNPILVGMSSFVLPGLGQSETDRNLESVIFSSVEILTISSIFYLQNLGNNKKNEYQNYADENWSVVRYAEWINIYGSEYGDSTKIYIDPNTNLEPWERVSWSQLNAWESSLHPLGGFTHHLPKHGEQQYFELIGKYIQYKFGWKDFVMKESPLSSSDIPNQVYFYMDERAKANQFFYKVKIATGILFFNHLVSAVDAIIGTKKYNEKVAMNISIEKENYFGFNNYIPKLNLKVKF